MVVMMMMMMTCCGYGKGFRNALPPLDFFVYNVGFYGILRAKENVSSESPPVWEPLPGVEALPTLGLLPGFEPMLVVSLYGFYWTALLL